MNLLTSGLNVVKRQVAISCLLLLTLLAAGCSGHSDTVKETPADSDSIAAVDSASIAAAEAAAARSRADSLEAAALRGDSLREKHIVVDKESFMLYLLEEGRTLLSFRICVGKGIGQKKRAGDHKTPEGEYQIRTIENAAGWDYDFHDGKGRVKGAYGPWFFRLNTPQSTHIGIHGTLFPETMGTRDSDGCIRMRNEDLEQLKAHVTVGMKVIINPDKV